MPCPASGGARALARAPAASWKRKRKRQRWRTIHHPLTRLLPAAAVAAAAAAAAAAAGLHALLGSPKKGIRKEACWTISNITAGTPEQISHVFHAELVPQLIQQVERERGGNVWPLRC